MNMYSTVNHLIRIWGAHSQVKHNVCHEYVHYHESCDKKFGCTVHTIINHHAKWTQRLIECELTETMALLKT
jgi:hypothetical protein